MLIFCCVPLASIFLKGIPNDVNQFSIISSRWYIYMSVFSVDQNMVNVQKKPLKTTTTTTTKLEISVLSQRQWNDLANLASWRHNMETLPAILGLYSLNGKTSYRQISWTLEAARFGFRLLQSLRNLTGTSAAALPRYLPNLRAIRSS